MKKTLLIFLITLFSHSLYAQTTTFFNDYHKISFQYGVSSYTGAKTSPLPSTLSYKFNNFSSPNFGFYCDILQTHNFNFKIGLSALITREIDQFYIDASEIPNEQNPERHFGYTIETTASWRFSLPMTAEYFIPINFGKLMVNSSFIIGYSEEFGDTIIENSVRVLESEEPTTLTSVYSHSTAPWYFNAQLGVGMYFPFERWMLRANVYYNFALQELYEGDFIFTNLAQSPDTSGDISFRGDSFGIEFSIYLKKKKKD